MDNKTQSVENSEKTVNLANMTVDDSMSLIWNALNKANSQGVFTIDESYVIKVAHNKVKTTLVSKQDDNTETVVVGDETN
jgi:glutathione synthase/RimK-type ligase-like ATP-grasp enzyme